MLLGLSFRARNGSMSWDQRNMTRNYGESFSFEEDNRFHSGTKKEQYLSDR